MDLHAYSGKVPESRQKGGSGVPQVGMSMWGKNRIE